MNIELQNYNSDFFRPTPTAHRSDNLLVLATPWGQSETLSPMIQRLFEHLDAEISQLETKTNSTIASTVEQALFELNSEIIQLNREEWLFSLECLVVVRNKQNFLFFSVGQHFVFALSGSQGCPVLVAQDISSLNSRTTDKLSPLPHHSLGLDSDILIHRSSSRPVDSPKYLVCSKTEFSAQELIEFSQNVQSLTQQFAHHSQQMPFWLAQIEVQNVSTN